MAQYQTFPGADGASRTLDKLKALKLPILEGRSFLDVGCNEGFFCGFARFLGASRVVGLDRSALFVERARRRFPDCEFLQQDWDHLPEGQFDVILLASALHYAEDQAALIERLVERLSPDGTLVLELGVVSAPDNRWVEVERGIDTRQFPTMAKLREVLADHAWKWMGLSVSQAGDPVTRHVVHISRRRPMAYLLMQPPGYGKSSIGGRLFAAAGIPLISGDQTIAAIGKGEMDAPGGLGAAIREDYSPFRLDQIIARIFANGCGDELVDTWAGLAGPGDFALDMFIPPEYQPAVVKRLTRLGYFPISLGWERVGPALMAAERLGLEADRFVETMPVLEAGPEAAGDGMRGFVDDVALEDGWLRVRGWVVDENAQVPPVLVLRVNGREYPLEGFERQARVDVQSHLDLPHPEAGYALELEIPAIAGIADIGDDFAVLVPGRGQLTLTARVRAQLDGGRDAPGGAGPAAA